MPSTLIFLWVRFKFRLVLSFVKCFQTFLRFIDFLNRCIRVRGSPGGFVGLKLAYKRDPYVSGSIPLLTGILSLLHFCYFNLRIYIVETPSTLSNFYYWSFFWFYYGTNALLSLNIFYYSIMIYFCRDGEDPPLAIAA